MNTKNIFIEEKKHELINNLLECNCIKFGNFKNKK